LKALNSDISRNLQQPLAGIVALSQAIGSPLRELRVGLRSGDTSPAERQRLIRKPPDILITTPESLHLMLTSRARRTLASVSHVIIDEIHALCSNKRGVFLSLLLERLEALNTSSFVRVGLSATQRPLEEVSKYLGGWCSTVDCSEPRHRPVRIVDAGARRGMDLKVAAPGAQIGQLTLGPVWPAIEARLRDWIRSHRSTIVFATHR